MQIKCSHEYNHMYDVTYIYEEKSKEEIIKEIETINLDEEGKLIDGLIYCIYNVYYVSKNGKLMEVKLKDSKVTETDNQFYRIGKSSNVLQDKIDYQINYEADTRRIVIRFKNLMIKIDEDITPLSNDMINRLFEFQKESSDLRQLVHVAVKADAPDKIVVVERIDI